jgi:hypothetical protein
MSFAKAGLVTTSAALTLLDALRETDECRFIFIQSLCRMLTNGFPDFILDSIATALKSMLLLWRNNAKVVVGLKLLQQVRETLPL